MRVAVAGAHGQIAQLMIARLAQRGDSVLGLIRNPDHATDISAQGVEPVLCDIESASVEAVAEALAGADAAVFAAGAGPNSGAARKLTVDRDGAVKLLHAAALAGVGRYVIVSAVGAEDPPSDESEFSVYLQAKAAADQAVAASDREWTIVRPGRLTDEPVSDRVRIDTDPFRGEVSRGDVASVLVAVLDDGRSVGATLYVNGGEQTVLAALAEALG